MDYGQLEEDTVLRCAVTLCALLDLPPPLSKFDSYQNVLVSVARDVCNENMKEAVEEAIQINDGIRDLSAGFDRTWQKRGHMPLNGVLTATSVDTGKVIDVAILSKYCYCKNKNDNVHEDGCKANYNCAWKWLVSMKCF
jgi:hypothetical protein